jgi:2-iminobutanoate/2-iminopropanoate deaminase
VRVGTLASGRNIGRAKFHSSAREVRRYIELFPHPSAHRQIPSAIIMSSPVSCIRRITDSQALPAPKFRYTPALCAGNLIYVSGLIGLDPSTGVLAKGGAYAETVQVLNNLQSLCDEQGWSIDRIVVARIYCVGDSVIDEVNRAWNQFFEDHTVPTRSLAVVSALPLGAVVEIEFQLIE